MQKFNHSIAVVTGAGSGIGRALAVMLSEAGARVAISDIDQAGLNETFELIGSASDDSAGRHHQQILNVADKEAMFAYADTVQNQLGNANLIINNAGVALGTGSLQNTSLEEFEWLMSINFWGVLYGTKAFLPQLEQAEWGHVVNISSLFGLIGVPDQSAYNASKFAVRGMTEALRQELDLEQSSVSATSIHPGGIKTNIARNARLSENLSDQERASIQEKTDQFDVLARTTTDSAAQQILTGVIKNKRRVLVGGDAKLMDWVQRHMPNAYPTIFGKLLELTTGSKRPLV